MTVRPARLADVAGFSIDRVAAAAGDDPDVLRLENLDTDLAPPREAVEATKAAVDDPSANSYCRSSAAATCVTPSRIGCERDRVSTTIPSARS